jgi:hypothetical protein
VKTKDRSNDMNELISKLMEQLGVREEQAKGGAGLLLKLAQSQLGADFSKIAGVLPGVQELIDNAPDVGGASKLLSGLAGALGGGGKDLAGLASLAGGFKNLDLDTGMIAKFAAVLMEFLKGKGIPEIVEQLSEALS